MDDSEMIQPDQIIRTRRRTIALIIRQDGSLLVRAPLRMSQQQIGWLKANGALLNL